MNAERSFIPTQLPPSSLCWSGNELIDWVSGGVIHRLDGSTSDPHVRYAYPFDSAVMSPDGQYAVIYQVLGTKGLVLKRGKLLREINRSFYHATAYEYPIALHTLPSGRTILAHCPDDYCRLELEDIETGERLTRRTGESQDIFHSRLQFSPDGRYLLSAGWIWHPLDMVFVFDVARALEEPESLDRVQHPGLGDWGTELYSGAFAQNGTLLVESPDPFPDVSPSDAEGLSLGVYSLADRRLVSVAPLTELAGKMMPMGPYVLGLFQHPKLIEVATGRIVERWPDLATGTQASSIIRHLPRLPPLALDPEGRRLAVGTEKGIELLRFVP